MAFLQFLENLGLSKYASMLVEEEMDIGVLHNCSDADMLEIGLPKGPRLKLMKYFERERNSSPPPCSSCVALQAHIRRINAELVRYKLENEAMTRLIEDLQQTNARGALKPGWVMTEEEADDNADAKKLTLAKLEAEKAAERAEAKKLALAKLDSEKATAARAEAKKAALVKLEAEEAAAIVDMFFVMLNEG